MNISQTSCFRVQLSAVLLLTMALSTYAISDEVQSQSRAQDLVLLNWSEYLDPELIKKFEKEFNANIKEVYYESDDLRDDMLLETEARGYDLAIVDGSTIDTYVKAGWVEPLDMKLLPNVKYVDKKWLDSFPGVNGNAAPYFWGTLGIAYRKDLVSKAPNSWLDLLKPDEYLRGKIGMMKCARDITGIALKALGHSLNSTDKQALKDAERLLYDQKSYVNTYDYLSLSEESALVSGEILMTMFFSGDALMVQEFNDEIDYVVPEEGGLLWVDYMVVLKSSNNKKLAFQFINFLNQPKNAAQLAEYVYYATPNKAAEKYLPQEFKDDSIIYPNKSVISKSEFLKPLSARAIKKRNAMATRVMQK